MSHHEVIRTVITTINLADPWTDEQLFFEILKAARRDSPIRGSEVAAFRRQLVNLPDRTAKLALVNQTFPNQFVFLTGPQQPATP